MNNNQLYEDSPSNQSLWLNDHLEAYLDGELPEEENERVELLLQQNASWKDELALAVNIRDELRRLQTPSCPPQVTRQIIETARQDAIDTIVEIIKKRLVGIWIGYWKPVLVTMTMILVATVFFLYEYPTASAPSAENITQAEIDQALDEIKWTLGYVSKTGRLTGASVQDALAPLLKDLPNE